MESNDLLDEKRFIFGGLFLLANKLQVIMDRGLAPYDLTAKQWFLTAVIEQFFQKPPTLKELATAMGSSHQNVKQLALKLEKKDFLQLEQDEKDRRALRLKITEKCYSFWGNRQEEDLKFINEFFEDLSDEEVSAMYNGFIKLSAKLKTLE